jgi:HPt (histidine-containing phosphotransfer) domain-containing protein
MAKSASKRRAPSPADAPGNAADTGAAIDRDHLARMTFGDRGLERELLELFDYQAAILIVRMRAGGADAIAPFAHTLKGSASGVGAGRVAAAAEAAELAAGRPPPERSLAIDRLVQAVEEVRAHIAELLREG